MNLDKNKYSIDALSLKLEEEKKKLKVEKHSDFLIKIGDLKKNTKTNIKKRSWFDDNLALKKE
jgi:hypothetical protein